MSTALATIGNDELDAMQRTAKMLVASGFFGNGTGATQIAQIATKIMAGREMGYGPFASVRGIHVIQGTPALSANLMAAAVKGSGRYDYRVRKMDDAEVSIEFFEIIGGQRDSLGMSTFTLADARKAQTKNLDKFARNMLFARAISNGVRWYCPDVFSGNAVYVPEELGADVDGETGEIIQGSYKTVQAAPVQVETPAPATIPGDALGLPDRMEDYGEPLDPNPAKVEAPEGNEQRRAFAEFAKWSGGMKPADKDAFRHFLATESQVGIPDSFADATPDQLANFADWLQDNNRSMAKYRSEFAKVKTAA